MRRAPRAEESSAHSFIFMYNKLSDVFRLSAVKLGIGYAAGCLGACFCDDTLRVIMLAAAAVLTAACFVMHREKLRVFGIFLGILSMSAYLWLYCTPLKALDGSELRADCRVTSISYSSNGYSVGRAQCILDGKPALITLTGNYEAEPGDILDATITITQADSDMFTFSDGIVMEGGLQELHGVRHGFSLLRWSEKLRSAAAQRFMELGGDEAELCCGLLLGNMSGFSLALRRDITYSGVNYMTAVSGAHITLVLMLLMQLFGREKRSQAYIVIIVVPVLAVLFGFSPSVMRAGIMMLVSKCAVLFCRKAEMVNSLCVAFLALTIVTPYAAADPALLMSVLGVFGVAVVGPLVNDLHRFGFERFKALSKIKEAAVLSLCSMVMIAPISISCFGGISLAEVPASVALTPFFTAAIPLGLIYLATGLTAVAVPLYFVMKCFRVILGFFGGISGVWLAGDYGAAVPLAFLAAVVLVIAAFYADWTKYALQAFALILALSVCMGIYNDRTRHHIDFVSDGKSGAAVICTQNEACIVISGTGSGLSKKLFNEFTRSGITHVRLIIAPQLDYSGTVCLSELAELFPVEQLLCPESEDKHAQRLLSDTVTGRAADTITMNGRTITCAKSGDETAAGDIVIYWGYTRSEPKHSAGLPVYVSAWQNVIPAGGVNVYDEPLRIDLKE